jgi:hypothetical protein
MEHGTVKPASSNVTWVATLTHLVALSLKYMLFSVAVNLRKMPVAV